MNQRGSSLLAILMVVGGMAVGGQYLMNHRAQVAVEYANSARTEAAFRLVTDQSLLTSRVIQGGGAPLAGMGCNSTGTGTATTYSVPLASGPFTGSIFRSRCFFTAGTNYFLKTELVPAATATSRAISSVSLQVDTSVPSGPLPTECWGRPQSLGGKILKYDTATGTYKTSVGCTLHEIALTDTGRFSIPTGVSQLLIQALGGGGGGAKQWSTASGAGGGYVSGVLDVGVGKPGGTSIAYAVGGGGWAHTEPDYYYGCQAYNKKGQCKQWGQIWKPGGSGTANGGAGGNTTVTWPAGSILAGGGGGAIMGGTAGACWGGCYYGPPSPGGNASVVGTSLQGVMPVSATAVIRSGTPSNNAARGGNGAGGAAPGCTGASLPFGYYGFGGRGMVNEGAGWGAQGAVFISYVSCP